MDPKTIKQSAAASLADASYDVKKLALIHTGVVVLFSLLGAFANQLLDSGMHSAGGLSGIGMRTFLQSGQVILSLLNMVLLPFWQVGFLYSAIRYSRREPVAPSSLLEGFRRVGPVFRLNLLLSLLFGGVMMACSYISTAIFMFSPFSDSFFTAMDSLFASSNPSAITDEVFFALLPSMTWLFVIFGILLLVIGLPMYYRYRMSEFALMNGAPGALAAMRESVQITRMHRMDLFRFDLSFWWYYGTLFLLSIVAFGDSILSALGLKLPIGAGVQYWLFYGVYLIAQLVFSWRFAGYYQTSYAQCYAMLKHYASPLSQKKPELQEQ